MASNCEFSTLFRWLKLCSKPTNIDEEFMELETDRFKDEYDRDSNGFIEADELIFWVSSLYFFHDVEPGGESAKNCD